MLYIRSAFSPMMAMRSIIATGGGKVNGAGRSTNGPKSALVRACEKTGSGERPSCRPRAKHDGSTMPRRFGCVADERARSVYVQETRAPT